MPGTSSLRRRGRLHLGRYTEIASVLAAQGFGSILAALKIDQYVLFTRRVVFRRPIAAESRTLSQWERLRRVLEELGPTFVKLGQFMSNRPDILPGALITELEHLQDQCSPFPTETARGILEEELGRPIDEVFARIEDTPAASASMAQVHKAALVAGDEVAVKIQRPDIRDRIGQDLDILFHLATLVERHYLPLKRLRPTQLVEEFERMIAKELDFSVEAAHMKRFRADFKDSEHVRAPTVYEELSSRRVLVTEFIHGERVSEADRLQEMGLDTAEIARRGAEAMLSQIFDHGFFHADPHPGNILVEPDGTLCFLDFGAVGIMPPSLRYHLGLILYGVVTRDPQRIIRTLATLSNQPLSDPAGLEYDIAELIEEYALAQLREINIGDILRRFTRIVVDHELTIVPGFYVLLRAIVITEGVGYRLDPEFNMLSHLEPYVKRLVRQAPRMRYLAYDLYFLALDLGTLVREMPFEVRELMRQARAGKLHVNYDIVGLQDMTATHSQLVNRLVFAIVLASLIIGSSLVIHSGLPPLFHGVPVVGLVGFGLAAVIGFGLLFAILRKRRM